jgi:DNA-binding GntR family transcriptional regulator
LEHGVRLLTKTDAVAQWIRSQILNGALSPGTQLLQQHVARSLDVSPTPVREAFAILEAEGFVRRRPHHGVSVVERDFQEIQTAYELRTAVEGFAVRRIVARDLLGLKVVEAAHRKAARAFRAHDPVSFRECTSAFHKALGLASGSETLSEVINTLVARSLFYTTLDRRRMRAQHAEHEEILKALRQGRAAEATSALARHIRANITELRGLATGPNAKLQERRYAVVGG